MPSSSPSQGRGLWWLLQLTASIVVLVLFVRAVEPQQLRALPGRVDVGLLLLAFAVKAAALLLHEVRVWLVLPHPRPPLAKVTRIGLVAGVINLVLPGRAGDLANIAMLQRRCGVSLGTATASMGVVAFIEAAVFGLLLLAGLAVGAAQWQALLGEDAYDQAMLVVGLATGGGLAVAVAVAVVGRIASSMPSAPASGIKRVLWEATTQTGAALASPRNAARNIAIAAVQVVGMVAAFAIALPAVGVEVGAPFLAAAAVLGLSAIAAVVLPPSYGAGPAAASLAVLSTAGASEADALAFAGAYWVLSQLPALLFGLPSMWSLGFSLSDARKLSQR